MTRKIARSVIVFIIGSSVAVLGYIAFPKTVGAQIFAPQPMRLGVKAVQTTLPVGTKGQILVTFLDRMYQPTTNDAKRRLDLKLDLFASTGTIEIPESVEALPGQREVPVVFTGRKPGRVLIRVVSSGLDPGRVLLTVTTGKRSGGSLLPSAWAEDGPRLEIFTLAPPPAPANGTSVIGFYVTLEGSNPAQTEVRIDSDPPCVLLYPGKNMRPARGSLIIVIPPEEQTSLEVQARTSQPGSVRISARALPHGPSVDTMLSFVQPKPASLVFEDEPLSIPFSVQRVPLMVHVADQDRIPLRKFSGSWKVSAEPSGNIEAVRLDPEMFVLSALRPAWEIFLTVIGVPPTQDLQVNAHTQDGSLRAAEKKLSFESVVGRLKVIVPSEVNSDARTDVKAQLLLKNQDRQAATEFPRTVTFFSEGGRFESESVSVARGATYASSVFVGREPGQKAELWIATSGVDREHVTVLIVTALSLLVPFALASGVIGGLARFFYYRQQSWDIWPRKTSNGWNPGLVGNAAFCGVFGVVMLLMFRFGLLHPLLDSGSTVYLIHTAGGAFMLGIAGGFIGVAVLKLLAAKLGLADVLVLREERSRNRAPRSVRRILPENH